MLSERCISCDVLNYSMWVKILDSAQTTVKKEDIFVWRRLSAHDRKKIWSDRTPVLVLLQFTFCRGQVTRNLTQRHARYGEDILACSAPCLKLPRDVGDKIVMMS